MSGRLANRLCTAIVLVLFGTPFVPPVRGQCEPHWLAGGTLPEFDNDILALTSWDADGPGPQPAKLVVGGTFDYGGGSYSYGISMWDGTNWAEMSDDGLNTVYSLAVYDSGNGPELYASGGSPSVAKWNGVDWVTPGATAPLTARQMIVGDVGHGSLLYAGGGSGNTGRLASWDGTTWTVLGAFGGASQSQVYAAAIFDDGTGAALYAAGAFVTASNTTVNRVAKWDGVQWTALGAGMDNTVRALQVFDDGNGPALYAGGLFNTAGGAPASRIAKWNGTSWTPVGSGLQFGDVYALKVFDEGHGAALYAAGNMITAGAVAVYRMARWDGAYWTGVSGGINETVYALAVHDDGNGAKLIAGGSFTTAGSTICSHVAGWNGTHWSALGQGVVMPIRNGMWSLDIGDGPALYATGRPGGYPHPPPVQIIKWDGYLWREVALLFAGHDNDIYDLSAFNGALYAAGPYEIDNGVPADYLVKWDGQSWSAVGEGVNGTVGDLTVFDDGSGPALYVTGNFTSAGSVPDTLELAKWDGTNWSAVGGGIATGYVGGSQVYDDGSGPALYVGGTFTTVGGVSAYGLARWDGQTWTGFGTPTHDVGAGGLIGFDDGTGPALYGLVAPGGVRSVARWDGADWQVFGSVIAGAQLWDLTVFDDGSGPALYASGAFTSISGVPANYIAKWDGTGWSALGNGLGSTNGWGPAPHGIGVSNAGPGGPMLHVGGYFNRAGGVVSQSWARWGGCSFLRGDMNCDAALTFFDIDPFLLALFDPAGYAVAYPTCDAAHADMNLDGAVNFFDIDGFLECLFSACP